MLKLNNSTDRHGNTTPQYGWAVSLGYHGDLLVVPVEGNGYSGWRSVANSSANGTHTLFRDEQVYASQEEALSAARVSVGLAGIAKPIHAVEQRLAEAARREAEARIRDEIEQDVRRELVPLVKRELLVEAREQALATRKTEKETKTMARAKMEDTQGDEEASLLDKAKALGGRAASTVKSDARKMALRSFGRKIVEGAQKGIVKFLADKGVGPKARQPLVELVESKAGKAVIGYGLGTLGSFIPGMAGKPIVMEACEELRVEAMSLGLDEVLGGIGEYLLPDLFSTVKALEEATGDADGFAAAARKGVRDADFVPTSS